MTDFDVSNSHGAEPPYAPNSAEALDAADEQELPADPVNGDSFPTDVPVGYVSDAELLAWLQAKSSGQYGELDQLMDTSNARSELVTKLSQLKETLAEGSTDPAAALAEIQALRDTYAGTDHANEIEELVAPVLTKLDQLAAEAGIPEVPMGSSSSITDALDALDASFAPEFAKVSGSIDATVKDLEHDDQLALVNIQALMSEIRETAQLTSNIIANRSQTSDSIVGNIRA
jgi:hypothetical protein